MKQRSPLQVSLLGRLHVRTGSGTSLKFPTRKAAALFAYLAVRPGHRLARPVLATLLWGEMGDDQARANLRHELFTLRHALGASQRALAMDARDVWVDPDSIETDLASLERAVAAGGDQLSIAVDLFQGDFLEGFTLREDAFEDWLRSERERVRSLALDALERWLATLTRDGRTDEAVQIGGRALALDPLRESIHRALMRLYAGRGARAEAARQYQACVDVLQRQLGTAPDPETTRLYRELTAVSPAVVHQEPSAVSPRVASAPAGPPLVGRRAEMARLARLVDDMAAWRGRVLVISGEAGVGKTRLVDELCARGRDVGARVVIGHGYQSHSEFVLGAWIELLRQSLVGDAAALGALGAPYRAELASLIPELAEGGMPAASAGPVQLFEAVGRVVDHWAAAAPLVLVLEDVHWADDMTLRLFASVARRVSGARVLLVATVRDEEPEYRRRVEPTIAELIRAGVLDVLPVGALSRESADALVRLLAVGSERPTETDVLEAIWRAGEGNPLAVVETMRAYGEGTLDARAPGGALAEPVRILIRQRLDRLEAPTRRVLETAAVIGRPFDVRLLQAASGVDATVALDHVEELVRRRMLDDGANGLDFSHDRIREVTSGATLPTRRRALHALVAAALESLYADRLDDHVHALAVHCREVEAWDKAVRYFCRAGHVALRRGANHQSIAWYEEALVALAKMPDTAERLTLAIDARIGCGQALVPMVDGARLGRYVAEAEAMCERLEDHRRLVDVLALKTRHALSWGEPPEVLVAAEHAHAAGERSTDPEQVGDAGFCLAMAASFVGDERRTVSIGRGLIERGLDVTRPGAFFTAPREVQLRAVMAPCLAELGDLDEARAFAAAAVDLAEARQRPYALLVASMTQGFVLLRANDARGAAATFERATSIGLSAGYTLFAQTAPAGLALARVRLGAPDEQVPVLEALVKETSEAVNRLWITYPSLWLAEAYVLAGRLADARRQADAALALARARGERTLEGWALWLLGDVAGRAGDGDVASALASHEAALAIAMAGGLLPLQAHCHVGLARSHARAGHRARARDAMTRARDLFRTLHLPGVLIDADEALLR